MLYHLIKGSRRPPPHHKNLTKASLTVLCTSEAPAAEPAADFMPDLAMLLAAAPPAPVPAAAPAPPAPAAPALVGASSPAATPTAGHDKGLPVGSRLEIYWTGEKRWYWARVVGIRVVSGGKVHHQFEYDADFESR